jgi:hypothetical protein
MFESLASSSLLTVCKLALLDEMQVSNSKFQVFETLAFNYMQLN